MLCERDQNVLTPQTRGKRRVGGKPRTTPSECAPLPSMEESNPLVRYNLHALVGKGSFGKVFRASNRVTQDVLAVKVIRLQAGTALCMIATRAAPCPPLAPRAGRGGRQ